MAAFVGTSAPRQDVQAQTYRLRAERELEKWRERLEEMNKILAMMTGDDRAKGRELRQSLEKQLLKAHETFQLIGDEADDDINIRMDYVREALEDTWAYWTGLVTKKDRPMRR